MIFSTNKVFNKVFFLGILVFLACKEESKLLNKSDNVEKNLFTSILPIDSGIDFINEIPESSAMNSMVYEYFYNGGGVAAGDVNNDGLIDLYFTANLKPNKLYLNQGAFKFKDVSKVAGVEGSFGWTTGATMVDINADGWLDIYVCKSGKGKAENRENLLYINNQNGTFSEQSKAFGLNFNGYSTQASFFDYDKDGDLDMFLLNHNVNPVNTNNPEIFKNEVDLLVGDKLYRNDNGKFIDISKEAGIIQNPLGFGLGVSIGDLNGDEWPDIYVANDYVEHDYLYYNNQDGTFTEGLKKSFKHVSNFSMGTDIADFNNDGLLDVITLDMVAEDNFGIKTSMSGMNPAVFQHAVDKGFHYQYMFNTLQVNQGKGLFSDVAHLSGVSNTDWSWSPLFADFDNDGLKDLFITNGLKRDFRNNDFRNYKLKRLEQAQRNGEKMSNVVEELVNRTPQRKTTNYLYKNNGDLEFIKMNSEWGITTSTFSNGAAYADLDNDGDLDLIVNNIDESATLLRNNSIKNQLSVSFKGSGRNPFGIGAKVSITTVHGKQIQENYPTRGYQSSVAPILNFGLDETKSIETLKVTWSDGKIQVLKNVQANSKLVLEYKEAANQDDQEQHAKTVLFKDITLETNLSVHHIENNYDDYALESLLPHKMSQFGPALAVGDVNGDGLDDFFIGGSKDNSAALYIQNNQGRFSKSNQLLWGKERVFEDVDAAFLDVDGDNDLDLYVVSGGNEWTVDHAMYQDRLYINDNGSFQKSTGSLPRFNISGSCVKPFDFDNDGDLDVFVGSRLHPQKYPYSQTSVVLINNNGLFDLFKSLDLGMVTDAVWTDFDEDGQTDLITVGEWTEITFLKNTEGVFEQISTNLKHTSGWWNSIETADFDSDGDHDYIVGNLGLNYKYKASGTEPFEVYGADFDNNNTNDIVLGYYNQGDLFPLRGRECSSNQMPFIKKKFPTYNAFGSANLVDVYGAEKLANSKHLKAETFASVFIENMGQGKFQMSNLPMIAQVSSINDFITSDFDNDGFLDVLSAGNLYQSEVETTRNDASVGLFLKGDGNVFKAVYPQESGVYLDGDVKKMKQINLGANKKVVILVARNNDNVSLLEFN